MQNFSRKKRNLCLQPSLPHRCQLDRILHIQMSLRNYSFQHCWIWMERINVCIITFPFYIIYIHISITDILRRWPHKISYTYSQEKEGIRTHTKKPQRKYLYKKCELYFVPHNISFKFDPLTCSASMHLRSNYIIKLQITPLHKSIYWHTLTKCMIYPLKRVHHIGWYTRTFNIIRMIWMEKKSIPD